MEKIWHTLTPDKEAVKTLSRTLNCSLVLATILVNRKITTREAAFSFLNCSLNEMRPPFSIKGMKTAVSRIFKALQNNEKILIFGDYDADGITATTMLFEFFQYAGADVSYYIPHRIKEGYSLQRDHITAVALPDRISLIITVDCGSSSHEAVKTAQASGIDVIITDHHHIAKPFPEAVAVINPKREDCPSCLEDLAGVGVAFYLLISLRKHLRDNHFWKSLPEPNLKDICDLVALGTIADVVPLVLENRIFTQKGLGVIGSGRRPGIKALIDLCKIKNPVLGSDDIAFRLAPKLNAAGRIDHAKIAVDLLTAADSKTAMPIAQNLCLMNKTRQGYEEAISRQIFSYIDSSPQLLERKTFVFAQDQWHEGVIGIVASKIVRKYSRPVTLIAIKDGIGKGSARSVPGIDLYEGLRACSKLLESFGGHAMAAGFRIKTENIGEFRKDFEQEIKSRSQSDDSQPRIVLDYELSFREITDKFLDQLESLQPFGTSNPEPLFLARNVQIRSSIPVGTNHRRMVLSQSAENAGKEIAAIWFNAGSKSDYTDSFEKVAFRLGWNRWNNKKSPQIIIEYA